MKAGASSNRSLTQPRRRARAGFSLPEVAIALTLVALMCMGIFPALHFVSRTAMNNAIRSEAHRLLQLEAERLTSVGFDSFTKLDKEKAITSSIKTKLGPDKSQRFQYPADNAGRVVFKCNVTETASTATSRTLLIEVKWEWRGKTVKISAPVYRSV